MEWITRYTWLITKEHYLLVRSTVEQDTGLGRATHRTTTTSYDYNQPVVIEVPELSGK